MKALCVLAAALLLAGCKKEKACVSCRPVPDTDGADADTDADADADADSDTDADSDADTDTDTDAAWVDIHATLGTELWGLAYPLSATGTTRLTSFDVSFSKLTYLTDLETNGRSTHTDRYGAIGVASPGSVDVLLVPHNGGNVIDVVDQAGTGNAPGAPVAGAIPDAQAMAVSSPYVFTSDGNDNLSMYSLATDGTLTELTSSPSRGVGAITALAAHPGGGHLIWAATGGVAVQPFTSTGLGSASVNTGISVVAPTALAIHPNGNYAWLRDATSGLRILNVWVGGTSVFDVGSQALGAGSSVAVSRDGKWVWATEDSPGKLYAWSADGGSGALTAVSGSPWNIGAGPHYLAPDPTADALFVSAVGADTLYAFSYDTTGVLTQEDAKVASVTAGPIGPLVVP